MPRGVASKQTQEYNAEVSANRMRDLAIASYHRCKQNTVNYLTALKTAETDTQRKRVLASARESRNLAELAVTNAAKYGVNLPHLPTF